MRSSESVQEWVINRLLIAAGVVVLLILVDRGLSIWQQHVDLEVQVAIITRP